MRPRLLPLLMLLASASSADAAPLFLRGGDGAASGASSPFE